MQKITKEFERGENERKDAVQKWSGNPRLFSPIYDPNNTYIALRTEDRMCSSPFPDDDFASFFVDIISTKTIIIVIEQMSKFDLMKFFIRNRIPPIIDTNTFT